MENNNSKIKVIMDPAKFAYYFVNKIFVQKSENNSSFLFNNSCNRVFLDEYIFQFFGKYFKSQELKAKYHLVNLEGKDFIKLSDLDDFSDVIIEFLVEKNDDIISVSSEKFEFCMNKFYEDTADNFRNFITDYEIENVKEFYNSKNLAEKITTPYVTKLKLVEKAEEDKEETKNENIGPVC